jgi:branched-chain amino acid transport system substrate-binding protein
VMKELVHDLVSQKFIKDFLEQAIAENIPIHVAIGTARKKLQFLKGLPNGEFLPVLFQNPEQPPLYLNPVPIDYIPPIEPDINTEKSVPLLRSKIPSRLLAIALLLFTGAIVYKLLDPSKDELLLSGRLSMGEQKLVGSDQSAELDAAYQYFSQKDYDNSLIKINDYLTSNYNYDNPEIVIFKNNTQALINNKTKNYKNSYQCTFWEKLSCC